MADVNKHGAKTNDAINTIAGNASVLDNPLLVELELKDKAYAAQKGQDKVDTDIFRHIEEVENIKHSHTAMDKFG